MATPATIHSNDLPVIALVGRVNVGKSTLFNKLIEKNKAIVSDIPGTTRTPNEGYIIWRGRYIKIIDTGGLTFTDTVLLEDQILLHSKKALEEADIILFVTDAQDGILPQEKELAKILQKIKDKPVLVVANKADSRKKEQSMELQDWMKLGLGEPFTISATNGRNVGDLLDILYSKLGTAKRRPKKLKEKKGDVIKISLIGKPNAGKSSLFNKLIGEDKVIVSDIAHTTREPHDTDMVYEYTDESNKKLSQHITFVDTAGIRRKANVKGNLEGEGVHKSIESVAESDMVLFVIDGSQPISSQDRQLGGLLERRAISVIIILNKWDLTEDNSDERQQFVKKHIQSHFPHIDYAPIVFTSSLTGQNVHKIFPMIMNVWKARHTKIPRYTLDKFIKYVTAQHLPSRGKGTRKPKVIGIKQIDESPPVFEMYIKERTSIHRSYVNYVENKLRGEFDFLGTPIIIKLKKMKIT